jgi:hypothetical protein
MCFAFLLYHSDVLSGPLQASVSPIITLTPQASSVECSAAQFSGSVVDIVALPSWLLAHVICAAFGFGFLVPIGAMCPASRAFRKKHPTGWFVGHRVFVGLGFVLGVAAFAIAVNSRGRALAMLTSHGKLGAALIGIGGMQVLMGLCRPHVHEGEPKSASRKAFEWVHPSLGWIMMTCIAAQLYLGYDLLFNLYWAVNALMYWRFIHPLGFILWAVVMVVLHPPPFLQRSSEAGPGANAHMNEKQIAAAV